MPSNYNNIDQAVVLPSYGLNDAQKLQFFEHKQQLDEQRQQRLYEKQQQQQGRNLNLIQSDLDFDKFKTGEQAIDGYAQGELKKISDEALRNHINDDPAQLEYWLTSAVQPLAQWHTQALGTFKKLNQTLQDYNKTYPNVDATKAQDLAYNQFQNDFLDQNGQRKNPDDIHPTDYGSFLQQPQVLGQLNNDTSALSKFFQGLPKENIGDENYTNKQGHVQAYKWSGMMPQGGELVRDENNKPTSIRLKGDVNNAVTDAQGNPMATLPNDMFGEVMGNNPAKAAAYGAWYRSPQRQQAEQAYMQQTKQPLTPDVENNLFKKYLLDYGNNIVAHGLKTEEIQKEPKITINTGGANANTEIIDAYNEIIQRGKQMPSGNSYIPFNELSNTAQAALTKDLTTEDKKLGVADLAVTKDKDGNWQLSNVQTDDNGKVSKVKDLYKITPYGVNALVNTSVKQKQKIIQGQQPIKPKQNFTGVPQGGF